MFKKLNTFITENLESTEKYEKKINITFIPNSHYWASSSIFFLIFCCKDLDLRAKMYFPGDILAARSV